jgi:hypothetical protein
MLNNNYINNKNDDNLLLNKNKIIIREKINGNFSKNI